MQGVTLQIDENDQDLNLIVSPQLVQKPLELKLIRGLIDKSEFKEFFIFDESISGIISSYKTAIKAGKQDQLMSRVGERRQHEVKCKIQEDQLAVTLTVTRGYAGKPLTLATLMAALKEARVVRGISQKRLKRLVSQCNDARPGVELEEIVAKGLPPRNGRPSKLQPLVQNALERILRPQQTGSTRVDMRNLGDVICVKKGTHLLRRLPPTKGRAGYSVTGSAIQPKPGDWLSFRPGEGTVVSEKDENLLIADIAGMPKFKDQKMWVDDTYMCKGVNVGTGNVN